MSYREYTGHERYAQRGTVDDYATTVGHLRGSTRASAALLEAGLSPVVHPLLHAFIGYACQNPGAFRFRGLDGEALLQQYRDANKLGYRLREVFRMLPLYKQAGCDDGSLKNALHRVCAGRYSYIVKPLVWDEWIRFVPKHDWAQEYRIAAKEVLDFCIQEQKWLSA